MKEFSEIGIALVMDATDAFKRTAGFSIPPLETYIDINSRFRSVPPYRWKRSITSAQLLLGFYNERLCSGDV